MSKLKHYKGDGWEVKVKYDDETQMATWVDSIGDTIQDSGYMSTIEIIDQMNKYKYGCFPISPKPYGLLINHLDNLTKPKIINEREFKNDNFHIRVWETEKKIGAETIWIKEGFEYNTAKHGHIDKKEISIKKGSETTIYADSTQPFFGSRIKSDQQIKTSVTLTYTDLCKALERAELETTKELTDINNFIDDFYKFLESYGFSQTKEGK